MTPELSPGSTALYIHWPFCAAKCPYCDFNSHVRESVDQPRWRAALLRELSHEAEKNSGARISSIFFGGGTPSLMQPETVAALIEAVRAEFKCSDDVEITLEANPNSVEADKFRAFAGAGVGRVSIGVQSFKDSDLKFLGRLHSAGEAERAIHTAQNIFPRVNFDLIYALPGQTLTDWCVMLENALSFGTEHLSLYQLTIEPNTGFAGKFARGEFVLPDERLARDFFLETQHIMLDAGLPMYEVSNHARGPHAQSRHNLAYWTYAPYIGIGPGAHQRTNRTAVQRLKKPEAWLDAVEQHGHGTEISHPLDLNDCAQEALMTGLRLRRGISFSEFQRNTGVELLSILRPQKIEQYVDDGFLDRDADYLRATPRGMLLLNALIAEISA